MQLLVNMASRGALEWEGVEEGTGPTRRRLRDLALLWMPDPTRDEPAQLDRSAAFLEDLSHQIECIPTQPDLGGALENAARRNADYLLNAARRARQHRGRPLQLSVFVVAQPDRPDSLGTLNGALRRLPSALSSPSLERSATANQILNFVQILDFDNFWGAESTDLRNAVKRASLDWTNRNREGGGGFRRLYLLDSRTEDGHRGEEERLDELTLFLELLLTENSDDERLQALFRSPLPNRSPIASFGVRLVEKSTGLMLRLAAAEFAVHWLRHLAQESPADTPPHLDSLREFLGGYVGKNVEAKLDVPGWQAKLEEQFQALEGRVLQVPLTSPDWPNQMRALLEESLGEIEDRLSEHCGASLNRIRQDDLASFPERLKELVTGALQGDAATVAQVIGELETRIGEIAVSEARSTATARNPAESGIIASLEEVWRRYREFQEQRLDNRRHRLRWLMGLFPLWLALGLTPLLSAAAAAFPAPDPASHHLWRLAYNFVGALSIPLIALTFLALLICPISFGLLGLSLRLRDERAQHFFTHQDKGRYVAHIRASCGPGGSLRGGAQKRLSQIVQDAVLGVQGAVLSDLKRVLDRLQERKKEMLWLRAELKEFLRIREHPDGSERGEPTQPLRRSANGIRHYLELNADLQQIRKHNLPNVDRYRSTQRQLPIFADWNHRFGGIFLTPLEFLDALSDTYQATPEQNRDKEAERWVEAVGHVRDFHIGFRWKKGEGLPEGRGICVLPRRLAANTRVETELESAGLRAGSRVTSEDPDRLYLVKVVMEVDPECLEEEPA